MHVVELFERDSLYDMYGRGYPYSFLVERFGKVKIPRRIRSNISQTDYQLSYVLYYFDKSFVQSVLIDFAKGMTKAEMFAVFGICPSNGKLSLQELYTQYELLDEYKAACKANRYLATETSVKKKYGVRSVLLLPSMQEKMKDAVLAKHGVDNVFKLRSVQDRIRKHFTDTYGEDVVNPSQIPGVQAKVEATTMKHFGVRRSTQSKEVQLRQRKTVNEHFGVDYPMQSVEVQNVLKENNLRKWGVEYTLQHPSVRRKGRQTMHDNNSFGKSKQEDIVYSWLVAYFGEDDVERQYNDCDMYPFACDFYIKSRNLYIEFNGTWTHGHHWYDADSEYDKNIINCWKEKNTRHYDTSIINWTVSDVNKRNFARKNNLNYVVFWHINNLFDVRVWFLLDCPDGCDWEKEYTWFPCFVDMHQSDAKISAVFKTFFFENGGKI